MERYLLLADQPSRQQAIAQTIGTSQQSVSQAARHLGDLIADKGAGLTATDRADLLEHWLGVYTGPGGQEFGWYSLDPVNEQTAKAARVAEVLDVEPLVSGDVAADLLAPWKLPAQGRIYVRGPVDLSGDGFVAAPVRDATLITCIPHDPTIWRLTDLQRTTVNSGDLPLADPAIVYWDLTASSDIDSHEAAERIAALITGATT